MKKALIVALVLGTSSAAMADSSFSFEARARISAPMQGPMIRDHRTNYDTTASSSGRYYDDGRRPEEGGLYHVQPAHHEQPIVINADCANWDPNLDAASACDGYRSTQRASISNFGRWTVLATRESAVPDHQYVAVEKTVNQIRIDTLSGRPSFDRVAVRYTDGETQVYQMDGCVPDKVINVNRSKELSVVVVYTSAGSRGTYSISSS